VPAVVPVVPVVPAAAVASLAPDDIFASVRMYFASALAAAPLAPAPVVPVVPAAVEPAVPVVPAAVVPAVPAAVLVLPAVFAAEFGDASLRHPVTVTVFSLLAVLGCVDGVVVCGAGVCAAMTAVAHAAIAAHKLVWIVFFIRPPATLRLQPRGRHAGTGLFENGWATDTDPMSKDAMHP